MPDTTGKPGRPREYKPELPKFDTRGVVETLLLYGVKLLFNWLVSKKFKDLKPKSEQK